MAGIFEDTDVVNLEAERCVGTVAGGDAKRHHFVQRYWGLLVLYPSLAGQEELGEWNLWEGQGRVLLINAHLVG